MPLPVLDLNDIEPIADLLLKRAVPIDRSRRHTYQRENLSRLMAQLTDDCFAFSGPLLPLDAMEQLIGERIAPVGDSERVPLRDARGRVTWPRRDGAGRSAAVR